MSEAANPSWTPSVVLDLDTCSPVAFQEAIEKFNAWAKDHPPTLTWENGWYDVTPPMSEDLLKRNKHNRRASFDTVRRYARTMKAGEWRRTGQTGIIDLNGETFDIQHRAWAGYFSLVTFPTYIVADVPVQDDLFAYIDAGKPRSNADALYTAGGNGLSSAIAQAIQLAYRYDNNALRIMHQPKLAKLSSPEVLSYSRNHPQLTAAAHLMAGTYPRAMSIIKQKGVAVLAGWKILEWWGDAALDGFMIPLGTGANLDENSPILALRNRLLSFDEGNEEINTPRRLALLIKAFQLHMQQKDAPRGGLSLRDNEKYPRFERTATRETRLAAD